MPDIGLHPGPYWLGCITIFHTAARPQQAALCKKSLQSYRLVVPGVTNGWLQVFAEMRGL